MCNALKKEYTRFYNFWGSFNPVSPERLRSRVFFRPRVIFGIESYRLPKWRESSCHIKVPSLVRQDLDKTNVNLVIERVELDRPL